MKVEFVRVGAMIYDAGNPNGRKCDSINEAKRQMRTPGKRGHVRSFSSRPALRPTAAEISFLLADSVADAKSQIKAMLGL